MNMRNDIGDNELRIVNKTRLAERSSIYSSSESSMAEPAREERVSHPTAEDKEGSLQSPAPEKKKSYGKYVIWIMLLLVAAVLATLSLFRKGESGEELLFEPEMAENSAVIPTDEELQPLGTPDSGNSMPYTEKIEMQVNDIPLEIFIPHNCRPELTVGTIDSTDSSILLATQAADLRADNGKIVGAYVVDGKPLSWGLSKRGYCGIIDGKIEIGVADNSPLFEEATEKNGHFFRQYPLVDNGVLVDNVPKNKSIRKALCSRNGEIMVVVTQTRESLHDFAQALVDLKVDNAIYLVGGDSYGLWRDETGALEHINSDRLKRYRYVNFILWRAVSHIGQE